ncbi:MAG TPA: hypothetical protein VFZ36_05110 [Vicinamibacterales bacterium]
MRHTLLSTLLLVSLAAPAAAQTPAAPPPMVKADGLPTVFLTDLQGAVHRGQLIRVAPDEVVLLGAGGERTFTRSEIALIETRGDSLKNGALIGASVGVLTGFLAAGISDCSYGADSCGGQRIGMFATSVALYTLIGVGIDALVKGRTVLYRAYGKPTVSLAVQPGKAAIGINVRW